MCGPIAAVAGFFKDTFEELNYIKMKYKNILISSHGDILLMVVDLKKHRKREHVDWVCDQLLLTSVLTNIETENKDPTESGIESGTESDIEKKPPLEPGGTEQRKESVKEGCDAKERLIATVSGNIKRL